MAAYDRNYPLVIDPVVVYSTYLGGSGNDYAYAIAVDPAGNTYITGETWSSNFPTKNSPYAYNLRDVFVTKINPGGTALVYSAVLGGGSNDAGYGIAIDGSGNACITGVTYGGFPIKQGLYTSYGGKGDAFVAKLNAAGNDLIYSTYLGGSAIDEGSGIAADASGYVSVTGSTLSKWYGRFPTKNPLKADNLQGGRDAFIAKINPDGTELVYSTYWGGDSEDKALGIATDGQGNAYITGETYSTDFPTKNPYQALHGGSSYQSDVFVSKINADGSACLYSTFLGGSFNDFGRAIALDPAGHIYVTGYSMGSDFPTKNSLFPWNGFQNSFVFKLAPDGQSLVYSTYLDSAVGAAIQADPKGNTYVVTTHPMLSVLNPSGTAMVPIEICDLPFTGTGVGLDQAGNIYLTGWGTDRFCLKNPLFTYQGGADAFVTKLAPLTRGAFSPGILMLLLVDDRGSSYKPSAKRGLDSSPFCGGNGLGKY